MLSLPITTLLNLTIAAPAPKTPNINNNFTTSLSPSCAPGGNFDLTPFTLQLPIGKPHHPDQIKSSKLTGCTGYTNATLFHTSPTSGALVMKVCGSRKSCGCVTTTNSKHCRTELREASPSSWSPSAAVNRLRASLKVVVADNSGHGTVVGQIHVDDSVSQKPVCELFVNKKGVVMMGVEQIPDVSSLEYTEVGKVTIGKKFEYEIRYEKGKLSVSIDGGKRKVLGTGGLKSPLSYFKAGNYNQGDSPTEVHFYSIDIQHGGGKKSSGKGSE